MLQAAGDSEEDNDFSKWTFKYTQDYQLIKQGENELTAKISCSDNGDFDLNPFPTTGAQTTSSSSPLSEWHTVNVTAVQGAPLSLHLHRHSAIRKKLMKQAMMMMRNLEGRVVMRVGATTIAQTTVVMAYLTSNHDKFSISKIYS